MSKLYIGTLVLFFTCGTNSTLSSACRKIDVISPGAAKRFVSKKDITALVNELQEVHKIITTVAAERPTTLREIYLKCHNRFYTFSQEAILLLNSLKLLTSQKHLKPSWHSALWDQYGNIVTGDMPFATLILKVLGYCVELEYFDSREVYWHIAVEDFVVRQPEITILLRDKLEMLAVDIDSLLLAQIKREYNFTADPTTITLVELDKIVRTMDSIAPRAPKSYKRRALLGLSTPSSKTMTLAGIKLADESPKLFVLPYEMIAALARNENPYSLVIHPK